MKALFIYNPNSGHHLIKRKLNYIIQELSPCFDSFDVVASKSKEHFVECINNCSKYDALIVSGGDGTINMAVNALGKLDKKPILGIIPLGTINDCVKNFNNPSKIKKAVKAIKEKNTKQVDIIKVNDQYVCYVAAVGAYSDIPYITGNKAKKIFGRSAYYFHAIPRLFKKIRLKGKIILPEKEIDFVTPFIMIMNGKRMGGFTINKKAEINDGYAEIYYAKPGIFNSLPKYFFTRSRLLRIPFTEATVEVSDYPWDLDGEIGPNGKIHVKILHNFLTIFS